jgi:hypothetical protein
MKVLIKIKGTGKCEENNNLWWTSASIPSSMHLNSIINNPLK